MGGSTNVHQSIVYGSRARGYINHQQRHFSRLGFPLVGQHGEAVLGLSARHNIVTLDTLETEKPNDAHNGVLAQLALYHSFAQARYLPVNVSPNNSWVREEHEVFSALRDLDAREGTSLSAYHDGPLGKRIRGLPPLALLVRMVDLTTLPTHEILGQMPLTRTPYFCYYPDPVAVSTVMAQKVLELYAPLAEVLGYGALCRALKDMAVGYLYPDLTRDVSVQMAELSQAKKASDILLVRILTLLTERFGAQMRSILRDEKSKGSSVVKMKDKPDKYASVEDFSDLSGAIVVVRNLAQVYDVVDTLVNSTSGTIPRVMHEHAPDCRYTIVPEDFIFSPKVGSLVSYKSFHVDIRIDRAGPNGRTHTNFEIIVRTQEMHEACEGGLAAHWLYKGSKEDVEQQRRTASNYDNAMLAIMAGSVAGPDVHRRVSLSALTHEPEISVTVKSRQNGNSDQTVTVRRKEGATILDFLVAAGVPVEKGVAIRGGRQLIHKPRDGDIINVNVGARRLGRGTLQILLRSVTTREAAAVLGDMLKNGGNGHPRKSNRH